MSGWFLIALLVAGFVFFGYRLILSSGLIGPKLASGISTGRQRGLLGLWAYIHPSKKDVGLLRVNISFQGDGSDAVAPHSYCFFPVKSGSQWQSVDLPPNYREIVAGSHQARVGFLTFDFVFTNKTCQTQRVSLSNIRDLYRGIGSAPVYEMELCETVMIADVMNRAAMSFDQLIEENTKVVAAIQKAEEEARQRAKEAEEKKKAEAEAKKAGVTTEAPKEFPPLDVGAAKVGFFFGSTTGNTQDIGNMVAKNLGGANVMLRNVTETDIKHFEQFSHIIIGIPTWHIGELQDDWAEILPRIKGLNLKGKKLAFVGLGDGVGYPDTYVTGMRDIWDVFKEFGPDLVGLWPTSGYNFSKSTSIENSKFLGLVIDIENQNDQSAARVEKWCSQIKGEMGL